MKKQFLILFAFISVLALSQVPQRFNKVIVTGDITSPKFIKTGSTADSVLLGNGSARAISTVKTDTVSLSNRINAKATGNGTANGTNTGDETLSSIKTKLGAATSVSDGYLKYQDWSIFNSKEPAITKNSGFNKNFGTTTGTVLEGRTFGTAANNNTGDFMPSLPNSSISEQTVAGSSGNLLLSSGGSNAVVNIQPLTTNTSRFYITPKGFPTGTTGKFDLFNTDYIGDGANYNGTTWFANNVTNTVFFGNNRLGTAARLKLIIGADFVGSSLSATSSRIDFNTDETVNFNQAGGGLTFGVGTSDPFSFGISNQYTFKNPSINQTTRVNIIGNGTGSPVLAYGAGAVRNGHTSMALGTSDYVIALNKTNSGTTLTDYVHILGSNGNMLLRDGGAFNDNGSRLQVSGAATFSSTVNSTGFLLNGNNLTSSLITNYIPKWNGSSFVNSLISDDGSRSGSKYPFIFKNTTSDVMFLGIYNAVFGGSTSTTDGITYIYGNNKYHIATNGFVRFSIGNDGNASILSTTPSTSPTTGALVVNGGVGADHVRANNFYGNGSNLTGVQLPITLTTNGTSGAATFSGNVLNVPNYTSTVINQQLNFIAGSTGGEMVGSMPFQTPNYKKVILYVNFMSGDANYTFPTAFSSIYKVTTNTLGTAYTSLTVFGSYIELVGAVNSNGVIIVEGY